MRAERAVTMRQQGSLILKKILNVLKNDLDDALALPIERDWRNAGWKADLRQ